MHFNRYRLRCRACNTNFCAACRVTPYHKGAQGPRTDRPADASLHGRRLHVRSAYRVHRRTALSLLRHATQAFQRGQGAARLSAARGLRRHHGLACRACRCRQRPRWLTCAPAPSAPSAPRRSAWRSWSASTRAEAAPLKRYDGRRSVACGRACVCAEPPHACAQDHPPCLVAGCPAATTQTGEDLCNICWVEGLSAAPVLRLRCGHIFHRCAERLAFRWAQTRGMSGGHTDTARRTRYRSGGPVCAARPLPDRSGCC